MIVATTGDIAGYRVKETKGEVFGLVVRSRGLFFNIFASIRSLFGGEIHEYTALLESARLQAVERMIQNAERMEANAVLMMRFDSSEISSYMSEVVAYGTAAVIEPAT
ncbi:MAG: YbjQ family protein [Candidatus Eremiobacteraeota bacterium]|nr:YbjQ family protein [Candidatus Eremiobacteraeota bacterium]